MTDQVNYLLSETARLREELDDEIKECHEQALLVVMFANRWDKERALADKLAQAASSGRGVDDALDEWHEVRYG